MNTTDLKSRWTLFKKENPSTRIRDAAKTLNVSEAELLATDLGTTVTRLTPSWYEMLLEFEALGEVMALTRNDLFVHEKIGRYSNASVFRDHQMGQTLDKDIDLRIFFRNWHYAFAVTQEQRGVLKRSLQFFDKHGQAVHKIHLRPESNVDFYRAFKDKYTHEDQISDLGIAPAPSPKTYTRDEGVDIDALRTAWRSLKDTHDFIFMLHKFNVDRQQAFRLVGEEFARQVDTSSFVKLLEESVDVGLPIMLFVNNPGCVQIHSGSVNTLKVTNDWYNILDPRFNLHVKYKEISATWIVQKPVETGHVHSLECFDGDGYGVSYIFSKRKEGQLESEEWRNILQNI